VAHGKDPYFPAWIDTAQLDYRLAATRAAMMEALQSVAAQCDGVRCDTAMLLLNDVFDKTWAHFPSERSAPPGNFGPRRFPPSNGGSPDSFSSPRLIGTWNRACRRWASITCMTKNSSII
jgi:hypothetical protein